MSDALRSKALGDLLRLGEEAKQFSLHASFERDPDRARSLTFDGAGLHVDFSKQLWAANHVAALIGFAQTCGIEAARDALFAGVEVNQSEQRAALHISNRAAGAPGLDRVRRFITALRRGEICGSTGTPLRVLVNLGIGGSDLGPRMAHAALAGFNDGEIEVRFASSLDPVGLDEALDGLDAAEVVFVVATKSFSTQETGVLAHRAVDWLRDKLGADADVAAHLVSVTARPELARRTGMSEDRIFTIDEGIGGRYSLSSAMGLSVMAAIGVACFDELLDGFTAMDHHFATEPLERNIAVLHGLVGFWNRSVLRLSAQAIVPFSWDLRLVPEHVSQLVMESNGKSVDHHGNAVGLPTAPVVFGAPGTEAQHSFFQLLHQGTDRIPVDLIGVVHGPHGPLDPLLANLLAQAQALAFGRDQGMLKAEGAASHVAAQRATPGDRPSTVVLIDQITPASLGALIALYEHSVFVQAVLWDINPYDQFGVELGKELAADLGPLLANPRASHVGHDASTSALIDWIRARR